MTPRPTVDDLHRIAAWGDPDEVPDLPPLPEAPARRVRTGPPSPRLWMPSVPRPRVPPVRWLGVAAAVVLVAAVASVVAVRSGQTDPVMATQGAWRKMAPSPLAARTRAASVWTGSEMLVFGGHGKGGELLTDGAAYDPGTDRWRSIAPYPGARDGLLAGNGLATWTGTEMLLFLSAVHDAATMWDWDLVAYNPATDRWRDVLVARFQPQPEGRLVAHSPVPVQVPEAVAWMGDALVIVGWQSDVREYAWTRLDVATGTWDERQVLPGSDDFHFDPKLAAGDGRRLMFMRQSAIFPGNRTWAYVVEPANAVAHVVDAPGPPDRSVRLDGPLTFSAGRFVFVGVRTDDEGTSRPVAYVAEARQPGITWRKVTAPPIPPAPGVLYAELVGTPVGVLLLGGLAGEGGTALGSDAAVERWGRLPDPPIDLHRAGHVAVWTGQEVLVWGGDTDAVTGRLPGDPQSDGAAYSVPSD